MSFSFVVDRQRPTTLSQINLWISPLKRYFILSLNLQMSQFLSFQKEIKLFLLPLKTHSAYMLFYKRMEPEEENGRDYKFDVSSELLEVSRGVFKHHQKLLRILLKFVLLLGLSMDQFQNSARKGIGIPRSHASCSKPVI